MVVQGCGPCTVKQLYQVRPTASYALYGQNLTPCAWFSHFHHIQCIKTAISNIVQSVEHFNFSSLFLKQKLIDIFLGRGCIFLIFLNLSVPGFARTTITRTTISEKLSSNFCELKIRRGILKNFSKKVILAFISFREVFMYI